MQLHELKKPDGIRSKKRIGRGDGSGTGSTAGKGHKGQKSRSGGGVRPGFEGGQMPLQRRLPKRGFTIIFKKEYSIVNVKDFNVFEEGIEVTPELLQQAGLIKNLKNEVKVLGDGDLERKVTVKAHRFSKQAEEKITAQGGKAEVI